MKFKCVWTNIADLGNIEDTLLSNICENVYEVSGDLDNENDFSDFLNIFDCAYLDDFNDIYECNIQKPSGLIELLKNHKVIADIANQKIIYLYVDGQYLIKKKKLVFPNIPNVPAWYPHYDTKDFLHYIRDCLLDVLLLQQGSRNMRMEFSDKLYDDLADHPGCGVTPAGCDLIAEWIERYLRNWENVDKIMTEPNSITLRKVKELYTNPYSAIDTLKIGEDCCAYWLLNWLYKEPLEKFVARKGYRCEGDFYADCPDQEPESMHWRFLADYDYISLPETLPQGWINEWLRR